MDMLRRIDEIWEEIEAGEAEKALLTAREVAEQNPREPAALLALAAASWANESVEECRTAAEHAISVLRVQEAAEEKSQLAYAIGWLARVEWRLWHFRKAEKHLREALELGPEHPWLWELLAQILERTNRREEAAAADRRAQRLDEEHYPLPARFSREEAEAALQEALDALPEEFQSAAGEVPIVLEEFPALRMARAEVAGELPLAPDILGLFFGVSLADRSFFHSFEPPGAIFLFQGNLERMCGDRQTLVEEIAITLEHELAHYLGFDESAMPGLGLD
jgi:predicted Zn-dependent protease with MMP-like domain